MPATSGVLGYAQRRERSKDIYKRHPQILHASTPFRRTVDLDDQYVLQPYQRFYRAASKRQRAGLRKTSFPVRPVSSTTHLPTFGRGPWANVATQSTFGPMQLLGTGKVLLVGNPITYSGHAYPTTQCALYDPSANTWTSPISCCRPEITLLHPLETGRFWRQAVAPNSIRPSGICPRHSGA